MESGRTCNTSSRMVRAMARNPCPVIVSFSYPNRRRAALIVFSESGRFGSRAPEKSIARRSAPNSEGSVMAAWWVGFTVGRASRRARAGLFCARSVTIA